jgi:hypothetical protein
MQPQSSVATEPLAKRPVRWLELLFVIVAETLFFQVVPDAWPRFKYGVEVIFGPIADFLWAIVDIRQWSLMGTAIRLTVILLFLAGLKAWKDRKI